MSDTIRKRAYLGLLFVGMAWAIGPVTIRLLRNDYDVYTLALARYIAAVIPLIIYSMIFHRDGLKTALKLSKNLLPLAVMNILMLLTWTFACYVTPAVTAQLIVKISVIFVVMLSFVLFHEERRVIRDPGYLLGTLVSFVGLTIVLTGGTFSLALAVSASSLLLILTALIWAGYAVWMKHLVTNIHPVPLVTVLAFYTTIGLAITAAAMGDITTLVPTDFRIGLIAFISGFVPIAMAHPVYHFAQKHLGSAVCSSWTLLNPLFTFLASLALLPNERLGAIELLGGCVLLSGTLCVTISSNRAHKSDDSASEASVQNLSPAPAKSNT
ncbi:MAG: DMT family transporter [Candidatus Hydrogenedentota bacterium]